MLTRGLVAISAAIILGLGVIHLVYTFHGPKLKPRDRDLQTRMSEVAPVITSETTMWKTWIGFNASHSLGLILFGLIYGYLALAHPGFLFHSRFLLGVGTALLITYAVLGKLFFFTIPFISTLV